MTSPALTHEGVTRAAEFILREIARASPWAWKQAARTPPLATSCTSPSVRVVTEFKLRKVPEDAARGIAFWSNGFPVRLLFGVPTSRELLELQACGERCVSLLPPGADARPHADALEFLLHDLRHVAKFATPEHHGEQVGFFFTFGRILGLAAWREIESGLDAEWMIERDHVLADMNGSCVFLFAAIKMKLKMAARRRLARRRGAIAPVGGALSLDEQHEYGALLGDLLELMGLSGELREAAIATSARRDYPRIAELLAGHFREIGVSRLRSFAREVA